MPIIACQTINSCDQKTGKRSEREPKPLITEGDKGYHSPKSKSPILGALIEFVLCKTYFGFSEILHLGKNSGDGTYIYQ